nr:unnamed protein product [Callosobruchus analis]
MSCLIIDQITDKLPSMSFNKGALRLPDNIKLANPHFNVSEKIDLLCGDISCILISAGLSLDKWISNDKNIMETIKSNQPNVIVNISDNEQTHSLGLLWHSATDNLQYDIKPYNPPFTLTKRHILSTVEKIYDPLGLVGPVIQLKYDWDLPLPNNIAEHWNNLTEQLHILSQLKIPRFVLTQNAVSVQFHGFADSSSLAYGACIYARSTDSKGNVKVNLLCAKSRVAPLKGATIPRLELCAALLLSRLLNKVLESWDISVDNIFLWTDSTIVLSWIQSDPANCKVFVAHRVYEIQTLTKKSYWHYVNTTENPADLISSGLNPQQLLNNELWWHGPSWLAKNIDDFQFESLNDPDSIEFYKEMKRQTLQSSVTTNQIIYIYGQFSSLSKLTRITAYILRFKAIALQGFTPIEHLSPGEIESATQTFKSGGRLAKSNFEFNKQHPIILSNKHTYTDLLIRNEHWRLLHAGPQLLLASLRENYWILNSRNLVRKICRNCIICFKVNPKPNVDYIMTIAAHLTFVIERAEISRYLRVVCIFICMVTRAAQIELVTELTTQAFLACLHRLVARRGRCANIYSDNGKNFLLRHNKTYWKCQNHTYLGTCDARSLFNIYGHVRQSNISVSCKSEINGSCMVYEDGFPPFKWTYGKVVDLHPGTDNVVRVVSVRQWEGNINDVCQNFVCYLGSRSSLKPQGPEAFKGAGMLRRSNGSSSKSFDNVLDL